MKNASSHHHRCLSRYTTRTQLSRLLCTVDTSLHLSAWLPFRCSALVPVTHQSAPSGAGALHSSLYRPIEYRIEYDRSPLTVHVHRGSSHKLTSPFKSHHFPSASESSSKTLLISSSSGAFISCLDFCHSLVVLKHYLQQFVFPAERVSN